MTLSSWDIRKINFEVGPKELNNGTVFDISVNSRFLSVVLLAHFIKKCISFSTSSVHSRHIHSSRGILGLLLLPSSLLRLWSESPNSVCNSVPAACYVY